MMRSGLLRFGLCYRFVPVFCGDDLIPFLAEIVAEYLQDIGFIISYKNLYMGKDPLT